jgi:preprotein translocase subunit SecG
MTFVVFAAGSVWHFVFGVSMFLVSLFLILLVLVQRGRGGGLTGALGGMGGQSAFGAKAGDVFTRVTMVTATIWILLCIAAILVLGSQDEWGGSGDRPGIYGAGSSGAPDDASGGDQSGGDSGEGGGGAGATGGSGGGSQPADATEP